MNCLPNTGGPSVLLVAVGATLLTAGVVLLVTARRERRRALLLAASVVVVACAAALPVMQSGRANAASGDPCAAQTPTPAIGSPHSPASSPAATSPLPSSTPTATPTPGPIATATPTSTPTATTTPTPTAIPTPSVLDARAQLVLPDPERTSATAVIDNGPAAQSPLPAGTTMTVRSHFVGGDVRVDSIDPNLSCDVASGQVFTGTSLRADGRYLQGDLTIICSVLAPIPLTAANSVVLVAQTASPPDPMFPVPYLSTTSVSVLIASPEVDVDLSNNDVVSQGSQP